MDDMEEKKEILRMHGFSECDGYWVRDDACILSGLIAESSPSFIRSFLDATERRSPNRTRGNLSSGASYPIKDAEDFKE